MGWNPFGSSGNGSGGSGGASETVRYTIEQNTINNKKVFRLKQTINGITSYVGMNITFDANDITYTSEYATTVAQALDYLYKNSNSNIDKAVTNIEFTKSSIGGVPNQPGAIDTYTITYSDDTTSTFKIYNGTNGTQGTDGKSAYDIWIDLGNSGTENDFINSLKGETGETGKNGKSAYEQWLDLGNHGTENDFINSLKGETGKTGKSAYEQWLDLGNMGTEADFIESLKGNTGYSPQIEVFKNVATWAVRNEVVGNTAYYNNDSSITQFDLTNRNTVAIICWWFESETISEIPLRINFYTSNSELPQTIDNIKAHTGHQFEYDTSAYDYMTIVSTSDINATGQVVYNDETSESGYFLKITYYNDISGEQTIITENLRGQDGDNGVDGKSAYDIWIDNGNSGTVQEFLNSLIGQNGTSVSNATVNSEGHLIITLDNNNQIDAGYVKGSDGTSVNIKGELNTTDELPAVANNGDGYIVNGDLWVYTDNKWINAGAIKGPQGETGNGIQSVTFTSSSIGETAGMPGATDTYTITFTNGETTTFKVYNGQNGTSSSLTIDTEMSDTSTNAVQNKAIKTYIDNIVGDIQTILETLTTVTSEGV